MKKKYREVKGYRFLQRKDKKLIQHMILIKSMIQVRFTLGKKGENVIVSHLKCLVAGFSSHFPTIYTNLAILTVLGVLLVFVSI